MKQSITSIILICLFSGNVYSQQLDYAKEIVQTLTSEEFAGRGFADSGVVKASKYIQTEFVSNNIRTLSNSYYQHFNVDVNTFSGAMQLKIGTEDLLAGKDFIVDPSSPSLEGEFEGLVIKVEDLLDNSKMKKIFRMARNKVLVIDKRKYTPKNNEINEQLRWVQKQVMYKNKFTHKATIILTSNKLTWHISSVQIAKPVFMVRSNALIESGQKVNINIDADMLRGYQTSNIIGMHPGKAEPDSFIVLTAHYDHLGKMGANVYIPGANDNASGVAMLLTLAKYFKAHQPKHTIVYMATSAEELGLLGAKYFVENPLIDINKIKFLINFDLAGTGDEGIKVVNGTIYKDNFRVLENINKERSYLPVVSPRGEACISDHCMFHRRGIPCFYIYTLGGIKAYHDINDKFETLPFTEFKDYSKLMIDFINSF